MPCPTGTAPLYDEMVDKKSAYKGLNCKITPPNYAQHAINQRVTNVGKDGATCMYQFLSHCSVYVLQPTKLINISETTKTLLEIFALVKHNLGASSAYRKRQFLLPNLTILHSYILTQCVSLRGKKKV